MGNVTIRKKKGKKKEAISPVGILHWQTTNTKTKTKTLLKNAGPSVTADPITAAGVGCNLQNRCASMISPLLSGSKGVDTRPSKAKRREEKKKKRRRRRRR